jgi:hypothetical protein
MAKVPAYHTDWGAYIAKMREVHHNHDDCPVGKRILPANRRTGTGGRPRCKSCINLD